jgi:hypothetical protein
MMPADLSAKLAALGVDLDKVGAACLLIVGIFDHLGIEGITRVAVLQLVIQATTYSEEEIEGPGFAAKVAECRRLLEAGDDGARRQVEGEAN